MSAHQLLARLRCWLSGHHPVHPERGNTWCNRCWLFVSRTARGGWVRT